MNLYNAHYFDGDQDNSLNFTARENDNREKCFMEVYKKEYGTTIDPADIIGIYLEKTVSNKNGKEYRIILKPV